MSMVATVPYNLTAREPVAARMFLLCMTSRMTIIRVRSTFNETETERHGSTNVTLPHTQDMVAIIEIPVAMIVMKLAQNITAGL